MINVIFTQLGAGYSAVKFGFVYPLCGTLIPKGNKISVLDAHARNKMEGKECLQFASLSHPRFFLIGDPTNQLCKLKEPSSIIISV